ncbi:MAG: hypothetical protein GY867_03150 [bacterium]|nr:hypothetical protein [bacterium]
MTGYGGNKRRIPTQVVVQFAVERLQVIPDGFGILYQTVGVQRGKSL